MIDQLEGDKIGLVIFVEKPLILNFQLPQIILRLQKMFLSTVNTKSIETQGTNLSKAINRSLQSFDFNNEFNKSIIIITDGEDHEEGIFTGNNKGKGVFIHTLAVGEENGGPIPLLNKRGFKKDREGNTIVTKPNFAFLSELVSIFANGINININNSNIGLKKLFKEINKLEKKK